MHGGVKETHVFHLHVHQWRAVPQDTAEPSVWGLDGTGAPKHKGSQLLDSITIGPQTGFDIDPLYGSGSRQHAVGDIIWHCHLYPHFHHGMWGLWRSFDRRVDGTRAYPDGTPGFPLVELPGPRRRSRCSRASRASRGSSTACTRRSRRPRPRCSARAHGRPAPLLEMGLHTPAERDAFDPAVVADPQPGVLFVDLDGLSRRANEKVGLAAPHRVIHYDVEVLAAGAEYNRQGWHDAAGHYYRLLRVQVREVDGTGAVTTTHPEVVVEHGLDEAPVPFFPRANHGDLVELTLFNSLGSFPADPLRPRTAAGGVRAARPPREVRPAGRRRVVDRLELPVGRELPRGGRAERARAGRRATRACTGGWSTRSSGRASSTTTCWPTSARSTGCSRR